jgi:hypothetical protein
MTKGIHNRLVILDNSLGEWEIGRSERESLIFFRIFLCMF